MFDGLDETVTGTGRAAPAPAVEAGDGTAAGPLKLHGRFDADCVRQLREPFVVLAETAAHDVVLDFADVGFLDGAGIGAIAFLHRRLAARRLAVRIAGASGQPLQMLLDLRLTKLLQAAGGSAAESGRSGMRLLLRQRA